MNWSRLLALLLVLSTGTAGLAVAAAAEAAGLPENLAPKARVTANSEYSKEYRAPLVADGHIPEAGSKQDVGQAWCVNGKTHPQGAELVFQWDQPVGVAEMIYYGRTAWFTEECWKDFEVIADTNSIPLLKSQLKMRDGPQRLQLPAAVQVRKLTLKFTSSYGGPNPGASEVQIFGRGLSEKELAQLARGKGPAWEKADAQALRGFIAGWLKEPGEAFSAPAAMLQTCLGRLVELEKAAAGGREVAGELAQLQRAVLLADVDQLLVIQRKEINATHVYTYHNEDFQPGGGLYLVTLNKGAGPGTPKGPSPAPPDAMEAGHKDLILAQRELVASPQGQMLDCDLSYDGKTVLFSWRQSAEEGYHLWQVQADGAGLKQLTHGEWHDYNGCWLPDGGVAFVSTRLAQFAYCWNSPVGVVHRMEADGSEVRRLSANYLNDFTPYPLEDGRIIYSRWEYVDKPAIPIQSLWTINPDGTGLAGYFGNRVISPGTFMEARSIPGTGKILCTMTGHNGPARGAIGVIDRTRGVNAQEAIWNVTPDVPVPPVDKGNGNFDGTKPYNSPYPLDARRFLVSARGPVLVRDFSGACQSLVLPAPGRGLQLFCAQPVRPRTRPPMIRSTLAAPPSSPTPGPASPSNNLAYLLLQDVYNGLEPHVKRGEVKRLRVVHELAKSVRINPDKRAFGFQFPVISAGATYAGKDVLGEVAVEADGSAYFAVPAGLPIYFLALDAQGRAVQRMRSFTHLMPGEVQGCVGCHEPRGDTAQRRPGVLALRRPPQTIVPPEWGPGGFDYAAIVQPVLDRHCAECHTGPDPAGKVDLSGDKTDYFNVSYETLARGRRQSGEAQWHSPYVSWIPSYNGFETNILEITPKHWGSPSSKLAEVILTGHPDEQDQPRIEMDEAGRRRILAWIDLNVPYYGSSETTHPDNQGSRRIYPPALDKTLAEVAARRCANCHKEGRLPRPFWTRLQNPQWNRFLQAPLAKTAGGDEACGKPVFATVNDPDYQAILRTFDAARAELARTPRIDMAGAQPSQTVNRSCK